MYDDEWVMIILFLDCRKLEFMFLYIVINLDVDNE